MLVDGLTVADVPKQVQKAGLTWLSASAKSERHLQCEAPVSVLALHAVCKNIRDIQLRNIVSIGNHLSYFEAIPLKDDMGLSIVERQLGEALPLSNQDLLSAKQMGKTVTISFEQSDDLIEAKYGELWKQGITLGSRPNLGPGEMILAMPKTDASAADHSGENI